MKRELKKNLKVEAATRLHNQLIADFNAARTSTSTISHITGRPMRNLRASDTAFWVRRLLLGSRLNPSIGLHQHKDSGSLLHMSLGTQAKAIREDIKNARKHSAPMKLDHYSFWIKKMKEAMQRTGMSTIAPEVRREYDDLNGLRADNILKSLNVTAVSVKWMWDAFKRDRSYQPLSNGGSWMPAWLMTELTAGHPKLYANSGVLLPVDYQPIPINNFPGIPLLVTPIVSLGHIRVYVVFGIAWVQTGLKAISPSMRPWKTEASPSYATWWAASSVSLDPPIVLAGIKQDETIARVEKMIAARVMETI